MSLQLFQDHTFCYVDFTSALPRPNILHWWFHFSFSKTTHSVLVISLQVFCTGNFISTFPRLNILYWWFNFSPSQDQIFCTGDVTSAFTKTKQSALVMSLWQNPGGDFTLHSFHFSVNLLMEYQPTRDFTLRSSHWFVNILHWWFHFSFLQD